MKPVPDENSSFPVSSSSKNDKNPLLIESSLLLDLISVKSSLSSDLVNEPSFHPPISNQ